MLLFSFKMLYIHNIKDGRKGQTLREICYFFGKSHFLLYFEPAFGYNKNDIDCIF
jgi:hypothetical protein